jgi:hypothetical protein
MAQAIEISASQVLDKQARPDGFEPPTTWFEDRHSIDRKSMIVNTNN